MTRRQHLTGLVTMGLVALGAAALGFSGIVGWRDAPLFSAILELVIAATLVRVISRSARLLEPPAE